MKIESTGLIISEKSYRTFPIKECIATQAVSHVDQDGKLIHDGIEILRYCMLDDYLEDAEYHADVLAALPCRRCGQCIWSDTLKVTGNLAIVQAGTGGARQLSFFNAVKEEK